MPIADLCSKKIVSCDRNANLQDAAVLMKKNHVGGVVVVETNGKNTPVGIITDRDIALCILAEGRPATTSVQDVMSQDLVTVSEGKGVAEVIDVMERKGVRRMVIVDRAGSACGVISTDDLIRLLAQELSGLGRLMESQVENEKFPPHQLRSLML